MLSSIGVKPSTSASGSQPSGNTKKDKIRITTTTEVPHRVPSALDNETPKPVVTLVYSRKPRKSKSNGPVSKSKVVQIVLWYLDSGSSKHMTGDRSQLTYFVNKFLGTVKFGNDHVAKILGYGDYQIGNVTISRDHLCSACAMGKSKKKPHKPKSEDTNQEKLYLLHMDLCGPMRVASVNGKKYILVIVDDYSQISMGKQLGPTERNSLLHPKSFPIVTSSLRNLGELQLKADIGIFIGYAPTKKAFRIYNRRTRRIIKIIHVDFDELTAMASEHSSSEPALHEMTPATISLGLVPNPPPLTPFVPPSRSDWDILFQPLFDELHTPPPNVDLIAGS
ncbi:retrovirus-related pol polyprotein from transposon TNT 1-94 [Tanacetum coccineum]